MLDPLCMLIFQRKQTGIFGKGKQPKIEMGTQKNDVDYSWLPEGTISDMSKFKIVFIYGRCISKPSNSLFFIMDSNFREPYSGMNNVLTGFIRLLVCIRMLI